MKSRVCLLLCRCIYAAGYGDKGLCAPTKQWRKGKHNTSVCLNALVSVPLYVLTFQLF